MLDIGADNTDLIITDGTRIWQRNVPIGGNHFTRALTKELKLTFAKAEHLKRNATKAPDPRAIFTAMRRGLQRLRQRGQPLDRLLLERQPDGEDRARWSAWATASSSPGSRSSSSRTCSTRSSRSRHFQGLVGDEV